MDKVMRVSAVVLACALSASSAWAIFESDKTLAERAKISMEEAIGTAQQVIPGQPVHVQMGKDAGHTVYKVEILDKDHKSRWVYIDATNGAVTEAKSSSLLE